MIGVDEALARILASAQPLPADREPLRTAFGRTLAQAIIATVNIPPFRNSAMDGYAVRAADIEGARRDRPVIVTVVDEIAAGQLSRVSIAAGQAARIMTGAPMPDGADTVVRFEETDEVRGQLPRAERVGILAPPPVGANVRHPGEDIRIGQTVLPAGTVLGPAELGVLASLGQGMVTLHRRPRVAILSTGDELVGVETEPGPGQIRDSNSYTLAGLVERDGGQPVVLGIARDRLSELQRVLQSISEVDVVISSAGVSAGDYDVVKQALISEGQIDLWQVNMKPGRPLAFGRLGAVPYLGLPGNPVAAMVSYEVFGRPLLRRLQGCQVLTRPLLQARAIDELENGSARRHFVRVAVEWRPGEGYVARLAGDQGAGILTSMVQANALAIVREGVQAIHPGQAVEFMALGHRDQPC